MTFRDLSSMPMARGFIGGKLAVADGKACWPGGVSYGYGGGDYGTYAQRSRETHFYLPDADVWTYGPNLPLRIGGHCVGVFDGKVYVAFGTTHTSSSYNYGTGFPSVYELDVAEWFAGNVSAWTTKFADVASALRRMYGSSVMIGSTMYCLGGLDMDSNQHETIIVLDVANGTIDEVDVGLGYWPLGTQIEVFDGQLYVIMGDTDHMYRIDPASWTWQELSRLPIVLAHENPPTWNRVGSSLVLAGGGYDYRSRMYLYDTTTDTWSRSEDLPQDYSGHAAALVPGAGLMLAGGREYPYGETIYIDRVVAYENEPVDLSPMQLAGAGYLSNFSESGAVVLGEGVLAGRGRSRYGTSLVPGIRAAGISLQDEDE